MERFITEIQLANYQEFLLQEEKSRATIEKYLRDIRKFCLFQSGDSVTKTAVLAYKSQLQEEYRISSINSMLASVNSFFRWAGWTDCQVKGLKVQREIFCRKERELSKTEYEHLLKTALAEKNTRMFLIMQTLCATGIRISELNGITVDAVRAGRGLIYCKGKARGILIPRKLARLLLEYAGKQQIKKGILFKTRSGRPLDRSYIWTELKKIGERAGVMAEKVFPHNFRHLFARTFYRQEKDIVRLADILGHGSVETTRIYTIESGEEHARKMNRLGLIRMHLEGK